MALNKNNDWTGNSHSTFVCLGASNHTEKERETNDYYATDPHSLIIFLEKLKQDGIVLNRNIWECACGGGHLSKVLENGGYNVLSSDKVDRGYGIIKDFLTCDDKFDGDILTNPPYAYAKQFVETALNKVNIGNRVIMLLKIQFLESKSRKLLFDKSPPKYVYVNSERQLCSMNGNFEKYTASALCYCWFVWEKGYKGETIVRWI